MTTTQHYIGRLGDGSRVWVDISLERRPAREGMRTVEHNRLAKDSSFYTVAFSGLVVDKGRRTISAAGQLTWELSDIHEPAEGWSHTEIRTLTALWEQWHLNHLHGACAHMDLPDDERYDARKDIVCPLTGYKYGSAWLVLPLPDGIVAEVKRLQSLPTGKAAPS